MAFEPLYDPQNVGSGVTSEVLFAPVAFFASGGIKNPPQGLTSVVDTHTFKPEKGFLKMQSAPWKNKLNADSIGEPGSQKFGIKLEFFVPGTYASLHAFMRNANNAPGIFLAKDADNPNFLYQLGGTNSYAYLSASFETGTEKEGSKGWKITVQTYSAGLIDYAGAITYFEDGLVVPPEPKFVYWGEKSTQPALTEAQIKATPTHAYVQGADITAAFPNTTPKYLWVAYPATEAGIVKYSVVGNPLEVNQPLTANSTFSAPVLVGDLFYIQSVIATQTGGASVLFQH